MKGFPRESFIRRPAWLIVLVLFSATSDCRGQIITLDRPGEREFILDKADLITPDDEQRIRQLCDRLLTDTASPIVVVTIESMSAYSRRGPMSLESFARTLFDQWGIGHLTVNGRPSNTGMLLLVARDERKLRIELGVGWTNEKDAAVQDIVSNVIVPRFRNGDFSGGIVAGVDALDQMARGQRSAPESAAPSRGFGTSGAPGGGAGALPGLIGCGAIGIVIAVFIARMLGGGLSHYGRRRHGWYGPGMLGGPYIGGWGGYGGRGLSGRGGGFSGGFRGGSFGGGFSGGRGASGSW